MRRFDPRAITVDVASLVDAVVIEKVRAARAFRLFDHLALADRGVLEGVNGAQARLAAHRLYRRVEHGMRIRRERRTPGRKHHRECAKTKALRHIAY